MPPKESGMISGKINLFEDSRIIWSKEQRGSFKGLGIHKLGPLEAGHTYMLAKSGAKSIVSIEANTRATVTK